MAVTVNDYTTIDDIKLAMPDTDWGGKYNQLFTELATAASRRVDDALGVAPGSYKVTVDEVRYFDGNGQARIWLAELATAPTSIEMDLIGDQSTYTLVPSTDYRMGPENAPGLGQPYYWAEIQTLASPTYYFWYAYPRSIKVTGKFGWSTEVPPHVKQVTTIQAIRWFKRAQQAFDDVGAVTQLGQLRYVKGLDPDLEMLLDLVPGRIAL